MQRNLRHARKGGMKGNGRIGKTAKVGIAVLICAAVISYLLTACNKPKEKTKKSVKPTETIISTDPKEKALKSSVSDEKKKTSTDIKKPKKSETEPTEEKEIETTPTEEFLLETDNVDYNYHGQPLHLSDSQRIELSHLIMGEAGGEGFEGCCLLAQCVRDAMVYRGYDTIEEVISGMSYNGYKYDTNKDVEDAINYIFENGNSAVQHRILVMYASDLCEGEWHETQNFVYQHNAVRFFDMWE